jgi:hypothetical protein
VAIAPNHNERQLMQRLRGRGWVSAAELSSSPTVALRLLERRWIVAEGSGRAMAVRLTDEGLAAKRAPIPMQGHQPRGKRSKGPHLPTPASPI